MEKREFFEKYKVKFIRVKGFESLMELNEDEEADNTVKKKLK